jgi:hypothetical protein
MTYIPQAINSQADHLRSQIDLYRDFIKQMAFVGIFKDAEKLISDIESGKLKQTLENTIRQSLS